MIETKGLQQGNYIQCLFVIGKVVEIYTEKILCQLSSGKLDVYEAKHLNYIPLTPEWLERMGCEVSVYKDEDGALVTMPGLFVCQPFYQRRHSLSISHAPKARKLRYVHDLQNYYQALTGEELTIKETV